jgi:hypothetical protein
MQAQAIVWVSPSPITGRQNDTGGCDGVSITVWRPVARVLRIRARVSWG